MMPTPTAEIGRPKKAGLERSPKRLSGLGRGTNAPGEGYALTIAERECQKLEFARSEDRHDVTAGVAAVAAKRASLIGRGPTLGDVRAAMDLFGLRATSPVTREATKPFSGLAHSYAARRRFVDAVTAEQLTTGPNADAKR